MKTNLTFCPAACLQVFEGADARRGFFYTLPHPMSIPHMNAAWAARISDPQAKLVLVRLADRADKAGLCWPSLDELASDTELHRSTVSRKVGKLEKLGWVTRDRRKNGCDYTVNISPGKSHSATYQTDQEVAPCDLPNDPASRTLRLTKQIGKSHPATSQVAPCDLTSRTVRLAYTREPSINHQLTTPLPPEGESAGNSVAGWWGEEEIKAPCTIEQAVDYGHGLKVSEAASQLWWHTRNASGWTKGSANGAPARKITSWQSDLATSKRWAEEEAHRPANGHATKRRELTSNDISL